jgi:hypothetical protein
MPLAGFEPMIPVFKQAKTVHALDHAATVTGCIGSIQGLNSVVARPTAVQVTAVSEW